jgi:hypothetical protein
MKLSVAPLNISLTSAPADQVLIGVLDCLRTLPSMLQLLGRNQL